MIKPSHLDLSWCNHHLQRQILMIFLFFGSSIAHLEPELQRFKDRVWLLAPVWLKFQHILTDLQTAVTRVLDEQWRIQKKKNHQNLTLKMMVTSNQVQLWRYSHTRDLFIPQKLLKIASWRKKAGVQRDSKKNSKLEWKSFGVPKIEISKISCKIKSLLSGLVTRRLYF